MSDGVLALSLQVISSGWKATERRFCCLVRQVGTVHRSAPTIAAEYIGPDALGPDDPAMFKITIGEDSAPAPVFFFFDSSFVAFFFIDGMGHVLALWVSRWQCVHAHARTHASPLPLLICRRRHSTCDVVTSLNCNVLSVLTRQLHRLLWLWASFGNQPHWVVDQGWGIPPLRLPAGS